MTALPESWCTTSLDRVLTVLESGSRPKGGTKGVTSGVPSVGGEHINREGGFDFKHIRYVPPEFASTMTKGHVRIGDVLVVKDGATTGKVSLVRPTFPYRDAVVNEHVFLCRPEPFVHPGYVFNFLFSSEGQAAILADFRGAAQGGISRGFANRVQLPVAPLQEQSRIVEAIETRLSRLDATVAALARVRANVERYRESVLRAACTGRLVQTEAMIAQHDSREFETATELVNRMRPARERAARELGAARDLIDSRKIAMPLDPLPEGWAWYPWVKLAGRITVGYVGPISAEHVREGVPLIRSQNVRANRFDPEGMSRVSRDFHLKNYKSAARGGDLCVVRSGNVGTTCVLPVSLGEVNCSDIVIIQRPVAILPRYGAYVMNSVAKIRIASGTVGIGLPHYNTKSVAAIPVPLPPIQEQERIVAEVDRCLSLTDDIGDEVETGLDSCSRLRMSILKVAFEGRLVPQTPHDEPASALLERISRERSSRGPSSPRRGKSVTVA